jgi:hypothetical protein
LREEDTGASAAGWPAIVLELAFPERDERDRFEEEEAGFSSSAGASDSYGRMVPFSI